MSNEIGSTLLNSLTKSTFDIGNMSKVIAEAEVAGPRAIVERGQTKATTELDALKYLQMNLEAFNTYVTDISSPSLFSEKQVSSSNEAVVSITASEDAVVGSYSIESRQLAQTHTQISNKTYSSPYDTISNGTLSIEVGGQVQNITVDATNNTLDGLQKVINSGDYGVTASVINNGGSYQLMFASKEQGAAGEMTISGLTDLDVDGLTTTADAQDAVMVINGLEVSSSTNTFDEVIEGVSFQLNSAAVGQTNNVNVTQDPQNVVDTIKSFVDVYNQLGSILEELGKYDTSDLTDEQLESEEYQFYGDLAGNSTLREIKSSLKESLSGSIAEISGTYNSLAVAGLTFNLDGELELDESVLNDAVNADMAGLSALFTKGGSSDDSLINVVGGNENTQAGSYALDITQLAERAFVTGGAATVSADEQVSGARITDSSSALTVDAGASLDITVGGVNQVIDLSGIAQTYNTKDEVAAALQAELDTAFGGSVATVSYDVSQARFEINANVGQGAATINTSTGLDSQGFTTGQAYAGQGLIDLTAGDATFDVKVDDSTTSTVTIQQDRYTLEELAAKMTTNINANADVTSSGNSVSVSVNGGALEVSSTRFGAFSAVELTGFSANFANSGFTADLTDTGLSVDGTLTTATGTINIGAYADSKDGRVINISDYAMIGGEEAEVRGLQFEVFGGALGARGDLNFSQGFGSRIEEAVNNLFDEDTGVLYRRMDTLTDKLETYDEKTKDIDLRYEKLELKYRMQFAMLQSFMSSSEATRNQLSAQFSNNNS